MEGCRIGKVRLFVIAVLICLFTACRPLPIIPEYIGELPAIGESVDRLTEYEGQGVIGVYMISGGGGKVRGILQEAEAQGFNDTINILVLIDVSTGLTERIRVLEHNETEDYGGYVTEEWFLGRFAGKEVGTKLELVKRAAGKTEDIVAITGATYTSQAVVDAVNLCMKNYRRIIEEVEL